MFWEEKACLTWTIIAEGPQRQPNLLTPDKWVAKGAIVKYHYLLLSNLVSHFSQVNYKSSKIEGFAGFFHGTGKLSKNRNFSERAVP